MWLVVNFVSDNSVSAVPRSWWKHGYCAWPKKHIKNKNKTIESNQKPNKEDFEYFKARLLTEKPIDTYIEAKSKAIKAQNTSDLSSAESIIYKSETKKSVKKSSLNSKKSPAKENNSAPEFSDSSDFIDDSDEDKLYVPELLNKSIDDLDSANDNKPCCSKTLCASPLNYKNIENETMNSSLIVDNSVDKCKVNLNTTVMTMGEIFLNKSLSNEKQSSEIAPYSKYKVMKRLFNDENEKKKKIIHKSINASDAHSSNVCSQTNKPPNSLEISKLLDEFKQLNEYTRVSYTNIKYDVKNLIYVTGTIKSMLENINNMFENGYNINNKELFASNALTNNENIPISDQETLLNVEQILETPTLRNQIVLELSRLVGKTIPETVRRMMQQLFNDNWLKTYSYIGFKGKHKFSSLHSCKIIFEAVRLCSKFNNCPDMEIAQAISKWMAQANNRQQKKKIKKIYKISKDKTKF